MQFTTQNIFLVLEIHGNKQDAYRNKFILINVVKYIEDERMSPINDLHDSVWSKYSTNQDDW